MSDMAGTPYKQNKDVQYSELHLNKAESMMNDAIMHKVQFTQRVMIDSLWQTEMTFDGATATIRFRVYTQSSKGVDKMSGASCCEFELRPGATQVENQYSPSINEVLNESRMQLIPYTPMIPVRKDIMKKCVNIVALLHSSPTINYTLEKMRTGGDAGMQQALREKALYGSNYGKTPNSGTQGTTTKKSNRPRGKGLFGMFKR